MTLILIDASMTLLKAKVLSGRLFLQENVTTIKSHQMIDVLGGLESSKFRDFRQRMAKGFMALQANAEKIIILVEMMLMGTSDLPCFESGRLLIG